MKNISLEELLEAGCHFGHQVTRQNPKARDYVFEARDGIHIIDLEKTKAGLEAAAAYLTDLSSKGGNVIVVGAKRQARTIVEEEVKRAQAATQELALKQASEKPQEGVSITPVDEGGIYYITNRWIGGILTNFPEITKNIRKFKDLTKKLQNQEEQQGFTKKEIGGWEKMRAKLESSYAGIADMKKIPDALFIIDTHLEDLVVREAQKMNVTTLGITDTNADPYVIDYPIAANDDAVGSIKLIVSYLMDAWIEGKVKSSKVKAQSEKVEKKTDETVEAPEKPAKKATKTKKGEPKSEKTEEKAVATSPEKIEETKEVKPKKKASKSKKVEPQVVE